MSKSKSKNKSKKRKKRRTLIVNTLGLTLAVVLLGYAVSQHTPALFAQAAKESLAAASVSVSAGVPPNPDNTLAQQLEAKAQQLNQEEQQVTELRQEEEGPGALFGSMGFYSLLASIALFLLVGANFYFDWRRSGKTVAGASPFYVDLRTGK